MLLSLKVNNCMIYNAEVEFSMQANMHYKRFPNNVINVGNINVLKTAVLIGPNNSGKTNFVHILSMIKDLMNGSSAVIKKNLFAEESVVEIAVSFLDDDNEYLFEIKYDTSKKEYSYERFARIERDKHNNIKTSNLLIRDIIGENFQSDDPGLKEVMQVTARNNLLIHLVDADRFPILKAIRHAIMDFASRLDVVDMNNIPIKKTIDMLKSPGSLQKKVASFVLNSDLYLEDYRYLSDDEIRITLETDEERPQENALLVAAPITEMLHLSSVYKGIPVPSMLFDSTGTKKMAALASYVIDALENGRILIIDELDNSLHFKLTRAIIAMFNNELNNSAQLIATVHDVSLLDCQTLFRKEQIWFTHKDSENAYLYSLAEFTAEKDGVRNTSDLIEKYRKGMFGALPEPNLFQTLMEVKSNG